MPLPLQSADWQKYCAVAYTVSVVTLYAQFTLPTLTQKPVEFRCIGVGGVNWT